MRLITVSILLFIFTAFAEESFIEGVFKLPNGTDIEIYKSGNVYNGKIVALNGYRELDSKNPKKELKSGKILGMVTLKGLKYDSEKGIWNGGVMYATDKGISVNFKVLKATEKGLDGVGSKLIMKKKMFLKRLN
jgi:hypothetical protein